TSSVAATITDAGSGAVISGAERSKLSGIETAADVTDTANVAAAGAVMVTNIGTSVQAYDVDLDDLADGELSKSKVEDSGTWDTAYGWGDHGTNGYLTTFSETDPVYTSSVAATITGSDTSMWHMAAGWGDHGTNGYLTGYSETDPVWGGVSNLYLSVSSAGATYVAKAGDTMTGGLELPANGLVVGTTQLIVANGYVGIGTANPTNALAVNGTIKAKEVIVAVDGWSDFVFEDGYRLMPLSEVDTFIQSHGHLPGIPSAEDVASGGVKMGEMQAKLLQKIEELTLHVLMMQKENTQQLRRITELEATGRLGGAQ
ncbi:MAG: hypothetical protein HQ523_07255, partial [Lentisphaerae bacterium]|nr:hypothetical protein [Lentisphaerota bacterium]